jgi:hypothetical protein
MTPILDLLAWGVTALVFIYIIRGYHRKKTGLDE